jgi:DNA modification methylase
MTLNTIYNEDCLKIMNNLEENSIDIVITDPPYGINYNNNRRNKDGRIKTENGILNDHKDNEDFLTNVLNGISRILKDGRHLYWFGRFDTIGKQIELMKKNGFVIKNQLIWVKNNHGTGDLIYSYAPKYEVIIYAIKKSSKKTKMKKLNKIENTTRHQDVLFFDKISSKNLLHDHQKPIPLLEFLIKKSSEEDEILFDPFAGSGNTALAAKNLNRKFITCELDTNIFEIAKNNIGNNIEFV